jgi:ribose transport system ATP-binding protein
MLAILARASCDLKVLAMLELSGVSKWFGSFRALHAVDFNIAPGEVVALVGANGAGKSTLMKVLGGLYADADYVGTLEGAPLDLSSPAAALNAGVGIVYQEIDLAPNLTVAENMLLGREPSTKFPFGVRRMLREQLNARATQILKELDIGVLEPRAVVGRLPIEIRQIAQVAKVLSLDSKVVVFDEPTARLSADGRTQLFSVIDKLRRAGKMVVFVSHFLEEVFAIADRVVVLRDGRLAGNHRTKDIDVSALIKMMVGEISIREGKTRVPRGETLMAVDSLSAEPAFRMVSFAVHSSEVLGITGIIGSGRHELFRSLIGQRPATGSVKIGGVEISRSSVANVVGPHLGFVPEDRKLEGLVPRLPIKDNLALPWLKKLSSFGLVRSRKVEQRAAGLIERLRLVCSSSYQPVSELSGGNQQKVLLGRWLNSDVPVVLLESPTVGVDIAGKEEIRQLVRTIAREGMGVVVSTDDLWELENLTDRILVMRKGEIRSQFQTDSMSHAGLLISLTGVGLAPPTHH